MAIDLNTARQVVRDSALHIGNSTFSDEKVDDAIKDIGSEFLRVTNAELNTTSITLNSGVSEVDLTSSITGFSANDYEYGEIDNYPVRLVPYQTILRRFQARTPKGRPTRIAFRPDDKGLLNKQADQQYTFNVTHAAKLTSFDSGTASNPSINLPDEYAVSVLKWGARYSLLHGAPGHPDSEAARGEWFRILRQANAQYGRISSGVLDASLPPTQQFAPAQGIGAGEE